MDLLKILKEEAGVVGGSFDDASYSLRFGKRDTILLGNYIYKKVNGAHIKIEGE